MYYLNRFKFTHSFDPLLENDQLLTEYLSSIDNQLEYLKKEFDRKNKYSDRNKEIFLNEIKEYGKKYNTDYYWYGDYMRSLYLHKQKLLKKVALISLSK